MTPKEQVKVTGAVPKKRASTKKPQPVEDDDQGDDEGGDDGDDDDVHDSEADSSGGTKTRAKAEASKKGGRGRGKGRGRGGRGRGRSTTKKGSGKGGGHDAEEPRAASVKRAAEDAGTTNPKKSKGADKAGGDDDGAGTKTGKKSKGAEKAGESTTPKPKAKAGAKSAPKAKAAAKTTKASKAKATEPADADQEEDRKKKSRKSCAYHKAKQAAIKEGKTAEEAKEAAKKVACHNFWYICVYTYLCCSEHYTKLTNPKRKPSCI